jgi:hypothetical protein
MVAAAGLQAEARGGGYTSPMAGESSGSRGLWPVLGWACFLGSSWTWVIGMVFPALLLRDFGLAGFVVFAVPNVIGAAAMGFVLRDAEASRRLVERHRPMAVRFSEVTLAFHFFVGTWLISESLAWPGMTAVLVVGLGVWAVCRRAVWALVLAAAITAVSLGMFAWFITTHGPAGSGAPQRTMTDLAWFAPAALVGFALCPYLDLTFHRARQATSPGGGRAAFALGFGGVFLAMIVFSLAYAGLMAPWFDAELAPWLPMGVVTLLGVHFVAQAGFTVGVHLREANARPDALNLSPRLLIPLLVGVALGWLAYQGPGSLAIGASLSTGETLYRTFLLAYGLVFPAYVFLVVWPIRRNVPHHVRVGVFLFASITALPMAFGGFVIGWSWWIAISLGVLVVARAALQVMVRR